MAGREPEVGIKLNVGGFISEAKRAEDAGSRIGKIDVSGFSKGVQGLGARLKSIGTLATGAFAGIAAFKGGKAIADKIADGFKEAWADQSIQQRAQQVFGPQNFGFIDEVSEKIKSAFGFDDGEARKAMTLLGEMGMTAKKAGASMSLVADIARAKNMSLEAAAKLVGKAFQGQERAALSLGVVFAKTGNPLIDQARLMDQLQTKFAGAAAAHAKHITPFERLSTSIKDTIKDVAAKLIPQVMPFVERFSNTVRGMLSGEGAKQFTSKLASGLSAAFQFVVRIGKTLLTFGIAFGDFMRQIPAALGKMWDSGALINTWLTAVGGIWKTILDGLDMLGKLAWNGIVSGWDSLVIIMSRKLLDTMRSILGEKASEWLGLDNVAQDLNAYEVHKSRSSDAKRSDIMSEFSSRIKDNFGSIGSATGDAFRSAGADWGASMKRAGALVGSFPGFADSMKANMARDTRDVYAMTGRASQSIGMSQVAERNAMLKHRQKLKKSAEKDNAALNVRINLQSTSPINPIMATA